MKGGVIMQKISKIGISVLTVTMLVLPVFVFAQLGTPTVPIGDPTGDTVDLTDIEGFITSIATFLITIALIIAVIFIIWGGIAYMMAGGDESKAGVAKSRIINGIIGAAVVLAVGVILQTLAGLIARTFFN
jgi:hypothetical protein